MIKDHQRFDACKAERTKILMNDERARTRPDPIELLFGKLSFFDSGTTSAQSCSREPADESLLTSLSTEAYEKSRHVLPERVNAAVASREAGFRLSRLPEASRGRTDQILAMDSQIISTWRDPVSLTDIEGAIWEAVLQLEIGFGRPIVRHV